VSLHPLAEQFATVAAEYERGRPEYPPAAIGALAAELGLVPGATVLDLAAGTGKLSRALLAGGFDVIAVEPTPALREPLARALGADAVKDGVAEDIPLPDASVDAVTVGDAFHWFDHQPALAEIMRVLRPAGGLAVLNTVPDWTGASWADPVGKLMAAARPEHPNFEGPSWMESVQAAGGWPEPREIRVTASRPADPDRVVDHLASFSWVAAMAPDERAAWLARAGDLIRAGTTPPEFPIHVVIGLVSARPGAG
jgi:SAM-dependent methyltransferase